MASRRLRIPKSLAVVLVGTSASVAVSFMGCEGPGGGVTPPDATEVVDDPSNDTDESLADASVDARPDARPDARRDAYVPPDTPVV